MKKIISYLSNESFIQAVVDDKIVSFESEHPKFAEARRAIRDNDGDLLTHLFENPQVVSNSLDQSLDGTKIGSISIRRDSSGDLRMYYRGLLIDNDLAATVVSEYRNGMPIERYARMFENLIQNESETAVTELYAYCKSGKFTITEDGHILAFKRIRADGTDIYTGTMNNNPGNIVEMPRDQVDPNRERTCSAGLHFCTFDYLPHYGSCDAKTDRIVVVKVNPRDIIAIPSDYGNKKGRACRYEVLHDWATGRLVDNHIVDADSSVGLVEQQPKADDVVKLMPPATLTGDARASLRGLAALIDKYLVIDTKDTKETEFTTSRTTAAMRVFLYTLLRRLVFPLVTHIDHLKTTGAVAQYGSVCDAVGINCGIEKFFKLCGSLNAYQTGRSTASIDATSVVLNSGLSNEQLVSILNTLTAAIGRHTKYYKMGGYSHKSFKNKRAIIDRISTVLKSVFFNDNKHGLFPSEMLLVMSKDMKLVTKLREFMAYSTDSHFGESTAYAVSSNKNFINKVYDPANINVSAALSDIIERLRY